MAAVLASTPPPSSPFSSSSSSLSSRLTTPNLSTSLISRSSFQPRPILASATPIPASSHSTNTTTSKRWSFDQCMLESLSILDLMDASSTPPDPALFCTLLKACADEGSLQFGRIVHQRIVDAGLERDPFVANSLISMYAACGVIDVAKQLFDELDVRNVVSWTTVISMYHRIGLDKDAVEMYQLMRKEGDGCVVEPNAFTYTVVLNCCARMKDLDLGVEVHGEVKERGFEDDEFIVAALIDMYAKCGDVDSARKVFSRASRLTAVAYTAMIEGFNLNGYGKEAIDVFRMITKFGPDIKLLMEVGFAGVIKACMTEAAIKQGMAIHGFIVKYGNYPCFKAMQYLVKLYEKCDRMTIARHLFDSLKDRNEDLWCKLVVGFARNELFGEALDLYFEMVKANVKSNLSATACALQACGEIESVEVGRQIHGRIVKIGYAISREHVQHALLEMYNKFGDHVSASNVSKYTRKSSMDELMSAVTSDSRLNYSNQLLDSPCFRSDPPWFL